MSRILKSLVPFHTKIGIPFIVCFSLIIIITSTSSCTPSESIVQTAIAETQLSYTETPTKTTSPSETPNFTSTSTSEPFPTIIPTNTPSIKKLNSIYDSISVPNYCKLKIEEINFSRRIMPPNTSGFYTYYEAKDPNSTFLDIVVEITNLDTIIKTVDDLVSISVIYDNNYTYYSSPIIEEADGSFGYSTISGVQPLLKKTAHYLITVPKQVEKDSKSLLIVINISDQEYQYKYR